MKLSKKEFIFHLFNVVFLFIFTVTAVELSVRYLIYKKGLYLKYIDRPRFLQLSQQDPGYQFPKEFYQLDPRYGWKQTPLNAGVFRGWRYPMAEFRSGVTINASGFRDDGPYVFEKDKLRIAVLGDSFIQALQVGQSEAIPELIERGLIKKGLDTKVYNFGVSSIGTIHQYRIFQEEALPMKPDIVILSFFPNDLVDNSPHYKHEKPQLTPQYEFDSKGDLVLKEFNLASQDGMLILHETPLHPDAALKRAARIVDTVKVLSERFRFLKSFEFLKLYLADHFGLRTDYDYPFDVYKKEYPPPLVESARLTCYLINKLEQECRRNGIRFAVVLLPAREQVLPRYWKEHIDQRRYILRHDQFDLEKPTRIIRDFLIDHKIPYVDALPAFQQSKDKQKYYYAFDHHFTAEGHRKVADMLIEYLLDQNGGKK
ncbi:MAG: SGNH/GDSL hydrolase family protein [Candidatus Omnitrophota bacterium]